MLRTQAALTHRRRRLVAVVMLATFAPLLVAASTAEGGRSSFMRIVSYVRGENNDVGVVVRVVGGQRVACAGTVRRGKRRISLPPGTTNGHGAMQWSWEVAAGVARAYWHAFASCSRGGREVRADKRFLVDRVPGQPKGIRIVKRKPYTENTAAIAEPSRKGARSDPYLTPPGYSIRLGYLRRRDLPDLGDARDWVTSARKKGFPTGSQPRSDAIAWFPPNRNGVGPFGHVAYVTDVSANMITTEDYDGKQPKVRTRTIPWSGLQFIYRKEQPPPPPPPSPRPVSTRDMTTARASHTATRLADGRVLVAGGRINGTEVTAGAELYDPHANTWVPAASMTSPRIFHTATLLGNGKVLVTGGQSMLGGGAMASAELYDVASNTWAPAAAMRQARLAHVATFLGNGKALVTGGQLTLGGPAGANADLYDPETNTWTALANMKSPRAFHTATLLENQKVLVTGGDPSGGGATATAELFNPTNNAWSFVPNMPSARVFHTATLLQNRLVLVTGGDLTGGISATAIADVYVPAMNKWTRLPKNMLAARMFHTATILGNGQVLVVGGQSTLGGSPVASAEVYDPATATWTSASSLGIARVGHTTTLLGDGAVLVTGGDPTGKVLVTGGESSVSASATASTEHYIGFGMG
jgi:surface antigen/N-acetylneuraminic acid mutarotase